VVKCPFHKIKIKSPQSVYVKFELKIAHNIFYSSMLNLSLFEGEQKRTVFVSVPLNVNELLLLAKGAVSFYLTHTCTGN